MAGEATHPDLINGSLAGILSELEQDKTFLKLAAGDIEASATSTTPSWPASPKACARLWPPPSGRVWPETRQAGRAGRGLRPRSRRDRGRAALLV